MSRLIPAPRQAPRLNSSELDQNVGARVVTQQLREVFREAFDNLGGLDWLVNFANANDQNARVFVQAISKLLPASAFPVDVSGSGIDALASAGHKWLCAGYGAGFVYLSRELLRRPPRTLGWLSVENPFAFDNRAYRVLDRAQRHELGCPDFAPLFALGAASEYLQGLGIEAISGRILALNQQLTDGLARLGLQVLSPGGPHRSGETLVALPDPAGATAHLEARGILVTEKPEGIRIATHFYNDESDLERCLQALRERIRPL